ncbi:hypothetical protein HK101_003091, partial [Irineochytrium annulatum]
MTVSAICLMLLQPNVVSEEEKEELGVINCGSSTQHIYHLPCVLKWKEYNSTCPKDRADFTTIDVVSAVGGDVIRTINVESKGGAAAVDAGDDDDAAEDDATRCMVCGECDHEDTMLLCDICDLGYHLFCIGLETIPQGDWFCNECGGIDPADARGAAPLAATNVVMAAPMQLARTAGSEREAVNRRYQREARRPGGGGRRASRHNHANHNHAAHARRSRSGIMTTIRREMAEMRRQRIFDLRFGGVHLESRQPEDAALMRHLGNQAYRMAYAGHHHHPGPVFSSRGQAVSMLESSNKRKRDAGRASGLQQRQAPDPLQHIWDQLDRLRKDNGGEVKHPRVPSPQPPAAGAPA